MTNHITVAVEDKANVAFEVEQAIGIMGVFVLVSIIEFRRKEGSPLVQGTLEVQISCFENPSLNRTDDADITAQGAAERIAEILHYRQFPFFVGQMIFKEFSRDDVDEANIVRSNYEVNTRLGYENKYFDKTKGQER